jgi:predicted metal-dependent phosphoesterase TrpH
MRNIDLHTHSRCSDGTLEPGQLVREAKRTGLSAIALTDHDTMAGIPAAQEAGCANGIEVIAGIEISANHEGRPVHLLGYGLDHLHPALLPLLEELRLIRDQRNASILAKLSSMGIHLDHSELSSSAEGLIGRPHIARLLVRQGHASSIEQAFRKYLRKNGSAYVAAAKFPVIDTIRTIKEAGGVTVLAHPTSIDQTLATIPAMAKNLAGHGLDGLEAFYPGHSSKTCRSLCELAARLGLIVTGGSDFHGAMKPDIHLGGGPVMPPIPYRLLEELRARLQVVTGPA